MRLIFSSLEPERGTVSARGDLQFMVNISYSNIIATQDNLTAMNSESRELLLLDMEYLHTQLRVMAGLGKGFEAGATVPVISMYGGFLDGFIAGFHDVFNIPNEIRLESPRGLFRSQYIVNDQTILEQSNPGTALGDMSLEVKKALLGGKQSGDTELGLRAQVKLPTGSPDRMTGSGSLDLGFGLAASKVGRRFGGYLNLNYHVLGQPAGYRVKNFTSLMVAFDYRFKPNLAMIIQYDQSQPFIVSSLPVMNRAAKQIIAGLRWRRSERFIYEFRFTEDLSMVSPDFTAGFQMTWRVTSARKEHR